MKGFQPFDPVFDQEPLDLPAAMNLLNMARKRLREYVGDESARPLLEQVRREWYTFTGYSQLKADIDHYLDESRISGGEE